MEILGYIIIGLLSIIILIYLFIIAYYFFGKKPQKETIAITRTYDPVDTLHTTKQNEINTTETQIEESIHLSTFVDKEEKKDIIIEEVDPTKKHCIYCDTVIDADSIFCFQCGKKQ